MIQPYDREKAMSNIIRTLLILAALVLAGPGPARAAPAKTFGTSNPFYSASTLPLQAPPFDRLVDADYQPAIEAGMRQQLAEIKAIVSRRKPATFDKHRRGVGAQRAAVDPGGRSVQRGE